ncbi:ATP synthase subunit delta [Labeo rohita]|uniref:ATP synthase subunit delta n=1 Tax=Labeo rohita TaxID=84645 RepID=A0ABQ8L429_LABRO|nr:ATP synthase subunit delta [Labeo rohita]
MLDLAQHRRHHMRVSWYSHKHASTSDTVETKISNEFYVDYNADLFGEFVRELREALVAYLKADTSVSERERYGIRKIRKRVHFIATGMVNHDVYVDPMARDCWLQEKRTNVQLYDQVRGALNVMFKNILQDFKKVSDKIRFFRNRNNWTFDRTDLK